MNDIFKKLTEIIEVIKEDTGNGEYGKERGKALLVEASGLLSEYRKSIPGSQYGVSGVIGELEEILSKIGYFFDGDTSMRDPEGLCDLALNKTTELESMIKG